MILNKMRRQKLPLFFLAAVLLLAVSVLPLFALEGREAGILTDDAGGLTNGDTMMPNDTNTSSANTTAGTTGDMNGTNVLNGDAADEEGSGILGIIIAVIIAVAIILLIFLLVPKRKRG